MFGLINSVVSFETTPIFGDVALLATAIVMIRILPQGMVNMPAGASSAQLIVKDSTGATVKTQAIDNTRGMQGFSWDGTTDAGGNAKAGDYKIEVVAKVGNENVSLATSVAARVSSVALDPSTGGLVLTTDPLGDVGMSDVQRVL